MTRRPALTCSRTWPRKWPEVPTDQKRRPVYAPDDLRGSFSSSSRKGPPNVFWWPVFWGDNDECGNFGARRHWRRLRHGAAGLILQRSLPEKYTSGGPRDMIGAV